MRLLHTNEARFQEFFDQDTPRYAILSHRWRDQEVSFQEMQYLLLDKGTRSKFLTPALLEAESKIDGQGHRKVVDFCKHAAAAGHKWVWIDTVCIDKSSSAELSEAINSMYSWYEWADCCYVYLWDVRSQSQDPEMRDSDFRRSEWWRRGWTLQELLAPEKLKFLNCKWQSVGTKADLAPLVHTITGIDIAALLCKQDLRRFSIATRMSWAAERQTSRTEDIAYCLLGLFGVDMPLLYGEGTSAFKRLCEGIISRTVDDTILVHSDPNVFASSPLAYKYGANLQKQINRVRYDKDPIFFLEAWRNGVRMNNALYYETTDGRTRIIQLDCTQVSGDRMYLRIENFAGDLWTKDGMPTPSHRQRARLKAIFEAGSEKRDKESGRTPEKADARRQRRENRESPRRSEEDRHQPRDRETQQQAVARSQRPEERPPRPHWREEYAHHGRNKESHQSTRSRISRGGDHRDRANLDDFGLHPLNESRDRTLYPVSRGSFYIAGRPANFTTDN